jgi:hypothetical protein
MYVLGGSRARDGKRAGPTIYELNAGREGRSAREIPRLVAAGLAITWHAGRRELITMAVLEVLSGVGVAAEVVVGRRVLEAILATQHAGSGSAGVASGWQGVWPSAVLLAGLYLPCEGRVCWDGRDTREVDSRELLSRAAIVFQDFIQYALSAGDNIALGRHERAADIAGIVRAAEQAGADRDIGSLPEGYQTLLGPAFIDGPTCRPGSGSGWRWRGRSSATRRWSSWTSRPPPWTRRPSMSCSRGSGSCSPGVRCC